jgi:hypothetical protein
MRATAAEDGDGLPDLTSNERSDMLSVMTQAEAKRLLAYIAESAPKVFDDMKPSRRSARTRRQCSPWRRPSSSRPSTIARVGALAGWVTPGILEAVKPGRMQGHGGTEEISR